MWEFAAPVFTIIGVIVAIYIRWKTMARVAAAA